MADANKPSYSFNNPVFGNFTLNPQRDQLQSVNAASQQPPEPPRIGPEIGPDPRSAIGATVNMAQVPLMEGRNHFRYDFAYGYRIAFPNLSNPDVQFKLRVYDLDSAMLLEEHFHKSGEFYVGTNKFYVRYRLEVYLNDELVFDANYDCQDQRVYIVIPDGGLGDNLAWLPYIEQFRIMRKAKVTAVLGEWMIRLSGKLYPGLEYIALATKPTLKDAYAIYFCGIFEADRKPWRPVEHQLLGMQQAVAQILGLPLENLKCRLPRGSARPVKEPYVCISTMATNPTKYWNYPDGWNILIRWLKSYGYRVFDIDRDRRLFFTAQHDYVIPSEAEDLTGVIPLSERIHYLEHADFFIGLPSGLSWLAWNCDIPIVMISGFTMPNCEFPTPYRVTNFLFCHGCWNDTNFFFDTKAPVWCPRHVGTPREIECTKTISPKMVQDTVMRIPQFQKQLQHICDLQVIEQTKSSLVTEVPPCPFAGKGKK